MKVLKLGLAAFLLYGAGVGTGVFAYRTIVQLQVRQPQPPGGGPWQQLDWIRRATKNLNLSPERQAKVDAVVREGQRHLRRLWEPLMPVAKADAELVYQRVLEELTADEREKFQAWMRDIVKRRPSLSGLWGGKLSTNNVAK